MTDTNTSGRLARILLVEDNYGDVLLAQEAFRTSGLANELVVAEDGEVALRMLRRQAPFADAQRPDIVLLDLNLPKRDGREVLEDIKTDPALKDIPVVILTGSRAQQEIVRSYLNHANAFIVKPVTLERLSEVATLIGKFWFGVVVLADRSEEAAST